MQALGERLLILRLRHAAGAAKGAEIVEGEPVLFGRGQFFFHATPRRGPFGLEAGQRAGEFADALAEFLDAVAALAVGFEKDEVAPVFLAEQLAVELEMGVAPLVQEHDHRRIVAGKGADQREPVFGVVILGVFAAGDEHEVKRPLGHEKAVRAVHDLLPAKVPHMGLHLLAADLPRPARDLDPRRAGKFPVFPLGQPVDERCLPHSAAPHEDELEFIERQGLRAAFDAEVVVEDFSGVVRLDDFGRDAEIGVAVENQHIQSLEFAEGGRQLAELVAVEIQQLQLLEFADGGRQLGEAQFP